MDQRRGSLREDGWWEKEGWAFLLKFTGDVDNKYLRGEFSELNLEDVVENATHVCSKSSGLGLGIEALFDAFNSGKPAMMENISRTNKDMLYGDTRSLARAIESGCLRSLKTLQIQNVNMENGHVALAKAISSGGLPSLKTITLCDVMMGSVQLEEYGIALRSGKLPSLSFLDISKNIIGDEGATSLGLAIRSGRLKNLAELDLSSNNIGDEGLIVLAESLKEGTDVLLPNLASLNLSSNFFTQVGMLSLTDALKSGRLDSLKVLDVQGKWRPSDHERVATSFVSAFSSNECLTVDLKYEWYQLPDLDRLREQLKERNSRKREILAELVSAPNVQATFAKVYLCGSPEVGKTTLRRTLQRSFWKSLWTWERRPHVEKRTRGIDVSQLSSKGSKPNENPITLLLWDMAGQNEFQLIHNAFFHDMSFAEGKASTFIVVCSAQNGIDNSKDQLEYWLRYIASSCDKTTQNPRHVFAVLNKNGSCGKMDSYDEQWERVLKDQRHKFQERLEIKRDLFLVDVRKFQQVFYLKSCLLEHSRNLLTNQTVPSICLEIEKNLSLLSQQRKRFPALHWEDFVNQVRDQVQESCPNHIIEAATKYLNEAGVVIYIDMEGVRLVVVDPNWLCREIIGNMFVPRDMASARELFLRKEVDEKTGSIPISSLKWCFRLLEGEWTDAEVDDMITILLWLGLCYKGKNENVIIPALIAEKGTPGYPWFQQTQSERAGDQWVMGFSVRHWKSEVALAPISLWHKFQVDLAQNFKFDSKTPDNDFVAAKYFMTFVKDYMYVLIEVDANMDKPTFDEITILVKPRFERDELDATERKQRQVDLADDLAERLLKLWNQICRGVEYEHKVVWPWPASGSRPKDKPERNLAVADVKKWVQERGLGRKMQWEVGSGDIITEDQLLPTKDKRKLAILARSTSISGFEGFARKVNDSLFELHRPDYSPKIQIVFFHGIQKEDYSNPHLSTWQSEDRSTIWPKTWLVEDIPRAHVLSISYSWGLRYRTDGSLDMYQTVENLLSDILQEFVRPGVGQVPHCPVVLVGHSIGGLVIKELCYQAHDMSNRSQGSQRAKLETFLKNIGGIFYYATPHHGSEVAKILAKKISNPLLTYFETLSKDTARLNSRFEDICRVHYKHWSFAGLGEGVPTDLGPLKAGVAPRHYWVVEEGSAREGDFHTVVGADHFSVCRPRNKRVRSFWKLRDFVLSIASEASDAEETQAANPLLSCACSGGVIS